MEYITQRLQTSILLLKYSPESFLIRRLQTRCPFFLILSSNHTQLIICIHSFSFLVNT
ncbi:hypothetical protein Hanom_Chr09g00814091 [Helianthus anomalus]